jgi:hypothetical protein
VIALVGDDGFRPVVWGIGETLAEAHVDALRWLPNAAEAGALVSHEITAEQAAVVLAGDVSWPIVVPA